MITFGQLYEFVLKNKTDKVFKGYTDLEIAGMLKDGLDDKTLYYSLDSEENITGMILFKIRTPGKALFAEENLSMSLRNLIEFARKSMVEFPGYTIEGFKHDRYRNYNKFMERIA